MNNWKEEEREEEETDQWLLFFFRSLNEDENCSLFKFPRRMNHEIIRSGYNLISKADQALPAHLGVVQKLINETIKCEWNEHVKTIKRLKEIFERNIFANRCTSKFIYSHAANSDLHLAW